MRLTRARIGFRFRGEGPSYSPKCGCSVCGCKAWRSFANRPGSTFAIMASPCSVCRTRTPPGHPGWPCPRAAPYSQTHDTSQESRVTRSGSCRTSGQAEPQPPRPSAIEPQRRIAESAHRSGGSAELRRWPGVSAAAQPPKARAAHAGPPPRGSPDQHGSSAQRTGSTIRALIPRPGRARRRPDTLGRWSVTAASIRPSK
jgi:hypothetical protein